MATQKEQTQDAKMIQLALYREYGFQPCLKDIEILESVENPDFPWHLEQSTALQSIAIPAPATLFL